eukprot:2272541-Amphidinium_carterae.1
MPAPSPTGGWLKRGMTTQEAQLRLRGLVGRCGCHDDEIKTHSLKVTLLSWCAKAGMDHDSRRLLGYHMAPGDKSMA